MSSSIKILYAALVFLYASQLPLAFSQPPADLNTQGRSADGPAKGTEKTELQTAVFGGGCFWCIEAVFERVWGVQSVVSGYSGGWVPNPTYEQVSSHQTGHAEVVRIEFDPTIVSYDELVEIFFRSHDPTTLNVQGPDEGTQYRSVIFYVNDEQKEAVERVRRELEKKKVFRRKIVTESVPLKEFYLAEEYHQDYFEKHPEQPYCETYVAPKVGKFEKMFKKNSKVQKAKEKKKS